MVEKKVEKRSQSEYLSQWVDEANYEVLPTEKALGLVNVIPEKNRVSVTCRPTGVEDTIKFVEDLGVERASRVTPHIAAGRILNKEHFDSIMERLVKIETNRLFVMGGDGEPFGNDFTKAEDVLRGIMEKGIHFDRIGVGGYPEGNSAFTMDPIEVLLRKQELSGEMGVDMEILTQMCFDVDVLLDWIVEIRSRGVTLPVVVGVPGKLKLDSLLKVLSTLGISDALAFLKSKPKLASSLARSAFGGFTPNDFLGELAEKNDQCLGIRGISIFTLGNITSSVKCLEEIK